MARDLEGRVALVTGSSTGIGRAVAVAVAREGARVVINFHRSGRRAEETADAVRLQGVKCLIVKADVSRRDQVDAMFARAHGAFGRVDFLVNAAGAFGRRAAIADVTPDLLDEVLAVNVRGTFLCCQAALKEMRKRGRGKIVNVASALGALGGLSDSIPFETAKGAVAALTLALARDVGGNGITVNAVSPGLVDTPLHKKHTPPDLYAELEQATARGRAGTAEEVASLVLSLLLPAGDAITGQIITVAAGR